MNYTLRQIDETLAKNAVPAPMADFFDEIPSYQDTNRVLKDLKSHRNEVAQWINGEVEKEEAKHRREKDALVLEHKEKAGRVLDRFAEFGIEPAGSTFVDFTVSWELVAEGLDKKQRDDRLLGRSPSPGPGTGVATVDPAVAAARMLRDAIDAVRDLDTRIVAAEARIEAVDPYEIDQRTVGYLSEFAAMGMQHNPGDDGRPVMDPDLISRAEQLGILGGEGPVM